MLSILALTAVAGRSGGSFDSTSDLPAPNTFLLCARCTNSQHHFLVHVQGYLPPSRFPVDRIKLMEFLVLSPLPTAFLHTYPPASPSRTQTQSQPINRSNALGLVFSPAPHLAPVPVPSAHSPLLQPGLAADALRQFAEGLQGMTVSFTSHRIATRKRCTVLSAS